MSLCVEEIAVNLGACRNLRSSRSVESFPIFGQVSLGRTTLGESSRLEYKVPPTEVEEGEQEQEPEIQNLNYEVKHSIEVANPLAIEEIIRNPLLVSVFEVLPKDKRAKEEKTHLFGIGSIDLLPLIQGQTSMKHTLKLKPLTSSSTEEDTLPEVDVVITVPKTSLLTPDDIQNSNILSLRIKGLYSLPENWSPGANVSITVATPRPQHSVQQDIADDTVGISLPGGEIKTPGDIDLAQSMQRWKWADLNANTTGLASLTDHVLEANAIEDESGQLSTTEDIEFRRNAESRKNKVVWNSELRIYLDPNANSTFLHQLSTSAVWPLEVLRISASTSGRAKSKEDDFQYTHHGVAYPDLSSLLYPGVTRVFGAYCIEGMSEADMAEKTNQVHTKNVMEYFYRTQSGKRVRRNSASTTRASVISIPAVSQADTHLSAGDSIAYSEAKTYILMEMELAKPLVPKRPASVIADKISEYIVPHPALPRKISGVEKAVKDFHSSTVDVAGLVLADYRSLFGEAFAKDGKLPHTLEERKRQLLYSLNTTGHYHSYKEHMKRSVVSIVRERFLNEANTKNEAEMQAFLSHLYTYLVDEMHIAMRKVFSLEESPPVPPTIVDCDMLRMYAQEAEFMQNLEMAEYYHKELLSREEHIALHWYEYGIFSLLKKDIENATQCFKRAVSLDQQFVPVLLLYGICCSLDEKCNRIDPNTGNTEAEEMMEMATTIDPNNLVAWTIRGLCYELLNKALYRDMCFQEAQKLIVSCNEKTYITPLPKPAQQQSSQEETTVTEHNITSQSLSQEIEEGKLMDASAQELGTEQQHQSNTAVDPPPNELQQSSTIVDHHHINSKGDDTGGCKVNCVPKKKQEPSPFLQTASYLLDVYAIKYAEMCLAHENVLQAQTNNLPLDSPSAPCSVDFHVAVARLQIFKKEYKLAESHLHLAIKEDILNSNLLAILGHCHYESGNLDKAREYYERVVEYTTPPAHVVIVLLRLANVYMKHEEFLKAKQTYIRACRRGSSSETWKGVGIACYMLEQYSEAEEALSEANLLNNLDPIIWAYLALVCYKTGRNQEATQAVNYAVKTGLKESSLIQQLQVIPCQ